MLDLRPQISRLRPELQTAVDEVLDSGSFILGPKVRAFEDEVARYIGTRFAVGVNSGTDALILALRALDVRAGAEVVTSAFTFFATAEAISAVGATPVFADIDPRTFNLDTAAVEAAVTERTAAIVPVHLYGQNALTGKLRTYAEGAGLAVVEDAAQAFGAEDDTGRKLGSLGRASAFSFFPSKTLGGFGDGGLVATDDEDVAARLRKLRAHGATTKYRNEEIGYNSRLDELQAALLLVKLAHVDEFNDARRVAARRYDELLDGVDGVTAPHVASGRHVFHQYTVRISGGRRDAVRSDLDAAGVASFVYYPVSLHHLPVYADRGITLPETERAAGEVLSLPIWPEIEADVQARVVSELARSLDRHA